MSSWLWNPPPRPQWRRLLLECCVIIALGTLVGFSANAGLLWQMVVDDNADTPAVAPASELQLPVPVLLDEARELLAEGALAVDARLPEQYREGHLPGAYNLPLADVATAMPRFHAEVAVDRTLVVYCNGYGCPDSFDLAERLMREGYLDVRVYEGGYPEWRDAGLPLAGEAP